MSITPVPSLSSSGWVRTPAEKIDLLMAHAFTSEYSQTSLYPGKVTSVQWIIQRYGNEIAELTTQLRNAFDTYLSRYYPMVDVRVTNNDDPKLNPTGIITLTIDIVVTEEGKQYSVGRELQTRDSKLLKVLKINNG